jgi:aspartokinase
MKKGMEGLIVHKFGGASLADADAMRHAIALAREAAGRVAVVASALAGVTDLLSEAGPSGRAAGRIRGAGDLQKRYRKCVDAVVPPGPARRDLERVRRAFAARALSRAPDFVRDFSPPPSTLLTRGGRAARILPPA